MTPKIPAELMGLGLPFYATLNRWFKHHPISGCWHIILCRYAVLITFWECEWNLNTMRFGGDCTPRSFSDKAALFDSRSQPGSYDSTDGTATDSPSSN